MVRDASQLVRKNFHQVVKMFQDDIFGLRYCSFLYIENAYKAEVHLNVVGVKIVLINVFNKIIPLNT